MKMSEKKPAVRWTRYQQTAASPTTTSRWFGQRNHGVAVIFGPPSGGLVSRDFDTMAAYNRWASDHPELASTLPTVETRRGRHVYATASQENVADLRALLGKPSGRGAIRVVDGELRAGPGCYSVLPPSIHPSGHRYRWIVPLPEGDLPQVDLLTCGFIDVDQCDREDRDNRGLLRVTEAIGGIGVVGERETPSRRSAIAELNWGEAVDHAILASLPSEPGKRHEQVFQLARALKALPEFAGAEARDLRTVVEKFHRMALPHISTKPFEETWIDFLKAWENVKFPLGQEPMAVVMRAVEQREPPAEASRYEQEGLRKLVSICRELQRVAGDGPFYLGCRTAGRLLNVDHSTANRWLFLLAEDGVIEEVIKGSQSTRKTSRYRYRGAITGVAPDRSIPF